MSATTFVTYGWFRRREWMQEGINCKIEGHNLLLILPCLGQYHRPMHRLGCRSFRIFGRFGRVSRFNATPRQLVFDCAQILDLLERPLPDQCSALRPFHASEVFHVEADLNRSLDFMTIVRSLLTVRTETRVSLVLPALSPS